MLGRALAVGGLFLTAGCNLDSLFGGGGARMQVVLSRDGGGALGNLIADSAAALADRGHNEGNNSSNARVWDFQTATVTLSSILVRNTAGELIDLDVDLPVIVDVVRIDGGRQVVLPDGILPADDYDQVVLVMTAVQGLTRDGTSVTIQPPGGGWTAVIPICPLEVTDGAVATVGLALNVRNSIIRVGNWWSFQPRFRSLSNADCVTADDDDENG
jgi:hypothetical protein